MTKSVSRDKGPQKYWGYDLDLSGSQT